MNGGIKIGQAEVVRFMKKRIIATKKQILKGTHINPNSKCISKCVKSKDLRVMEFPVNGFVKDKYYILSDFKK